MTQATLEQGLRRVFVWDVPVRLFHWLLLALILVAWFTGESEGAAAAVHRYAGEAIAGLLVFRIVWGFVGGERARFADFAAGPAAIAAHLRDLAARKPKRHLGHNPLGGVAVFLLLLNIAVIVVTGLFSGGDENAGPFAGLWGLELSDAHEAAFRVLQALVVVHVLGVAGETLMAKDALVPAMITGWKRRRSDESGSDARRASAGALIAALLIGAAVSAALMMQAPASEQAGYIMDEHEEYED
jgi:cytochrome b